MGVNGSHSAVDFAVKAQCYRNGVLAAQKRRARLALTGGAAVFWIVLLLYRLVDLQIANVEKWESWALKQHMAEVKLASERGPLLDRHNRLLAVSVPAGSIYVRPRLVKDRQAVAAGLSRLLNIPEREIGEKLDQKKPFVWVKRQVRRSVAEKTAALGLEGLNYMLEARRYYPYNQAASALIGKVGIDGVGLSGIEMSYERILRGEEVSTLAARDALGNLIQHSGREVDVLDLPRGDALRLTLDAEIQVILDAELESGRQAAKAKAAMGVMLDAESGEILAMGQAPAHNFNSVSVNSKDFLRNFVLETVFEPGSILKPIVAAAAIEAGVIGSEEIIDCESGQFIIGARTIKDVHPHARLTFFDVMVRSSNIGMSKVGLRLGRQNLRQGLFAFGLGQKSGLGLPGETAGILRAPAEWAKIDVATHSFGQGVAVTPLQVVRAVSAIVNGGVLPELSLVEPQPVAGQNRRHVGQRVISPKTAELVREMMYGVVENEQGTGRKAAINGVRVGGKTGTAQKPLSGARGYSKSAYVASFVGFVEGASLGLDRKIALIVLIDEPRGGSIYGGALAAPVFKRIMQRSLHLLSAETHLKPSPPADNPAALPPDYRAPKRGGLAVLTGFGGA